MKTNVGEYEIDEDRSRLDFDRVQLGFAARRAGVHEFYKKR